MKILPLAVVLACAAVAAPAGAATPPPTKTVRPVRVVLASAKLPSVVETPIHFKLLSVEVPAGQSAGYEGPNGFIYLLSGSLEVTAAAGGRMLQEGEASFVGVGKRTTLKAAGAAPAAFLHYLLVPAAEMDRSGYSRTATVTDLYRTAAPLANLKPGPHEFTMNQVSSPPHMPHPPLHYRSGAALYYVLAGSGRLHADGKAEPKARGTVLVEPQGWVHSWENTGDAPLILLQANISQEGVPEIIFLP